MMKKTLLLISITALLPFLSACGGSKPTAVNNNSDESKTLTETNSNKESKTEETKESDELLDLGLDNALLELDMVE